LSFCLTLDHRHSAQLFDRTESIGWLWQGNARWLISAGMAIVFPRACLIRTTQIVGSFVILNGMINMLKNVEIPF
jgi:cytochrome bd-type quinol oxidase subunit 2